MKRIIRFSAATLVAALAMASCEEPQTKEPEKVEYPDLGPKMELVYKDGEYQPKADPVPEPVFIQYCIGTWKLAVIKTVSASGEMKNVTFAYSDGNVYPFFSLRNDGFVRQYVDTPYQKTYADGSYSYDYSQSMLYFEGVVPQHPEFRIFRMNETEMHGTFKAPDNVSEESVLTLYVYKKLSYPEEAGLDDIFGAE